MFGKKQSGIKKIEGFFYFQLIDSKEIGKLQPMSQGNEILSGFYNGCNPKELHFPVGFGVTRISFN